MQYCSSDSFCCLGGTCDCSTGFNITTFTKEAVAYTTISVAGSGSTATSSSTVESSTSTNSAAITDASAEPDASTLGSSAAATRTASSSPTSSPSASGGGLSTGAKAGIGVGVAFGVLLLAVIGFLFWRTNRQHKELEGLKAQRAPLQPNMQDHNQSQYHSTMSGPAELSGQTSARAWQSPSKGYYHSGSNSTSTPSNPGELYGSRD